MLILMHLRKYIFPYVGKKLFTRCFVDGIILAYNRSDFCMISGKKGFTLIELLAVMVVLAVVLVIAVPTVLNVISNSKKGAFESDANLVLESLEIKKAANPEFDVKSVTHTNIHTSLGLSVVV
jgi:prepilin-type N-terminal cleavage/methylation domain-containing protein